MNTKRKSKKKRWLPISIIMFVAVGIAATLFMRPATSAYESVDAKIGSITTYYSFAGNVESKNRETVISEKVMQVSEIRVKEGDVVKEGDTLLKTKAGDLIKAKIAGEIATIHVKNNAQIMAGSKLMEIVDYDNLKVNVKVDEYDVAFLENGKETAVKIGAINKEIKGTISSMSKEGQVMNGVTFFTATIDLEKDNNVKIGMSAEVTIISDQVTDVVTLPMTVIQFDDTNQPYILKNGEKGIPVKTEITTGINDGSTVEVITGVSAGETIFYKKASAAAGMRFGRGPGNNEAGGEN